MELRKSLIYFVLKHLSLKFSESAAANLVPGFGGECTEQNPFGEGRVL